MKYYYSLAIAMIFVSLTAFYCEDTSHYDYIDNPVEMVDILAENLNFEGEEAFISDEPIRKEAFVIGVTYIVEDTVDLGQQKYPRPIAYSDRIYKDFTWKILCNSDFNNEYPAGSDVTKLFRVNTLNYYIPNEFKSSLFLRGTPLEGEHSFTIQAIFGDKTIETQTKPVRLY